MTYDNRNSRIRKKIIYDNGRRVMVCVRDANKRDYIFHTSNLRAGVVLFLSFSSNAVRYVSRFEIEPFITRRSKRFHERFVRNIWRQLFGYLLPVLSSDNDNTLFHTQFYTSLEHVQRRRSHEV